MSQIVFVVLALYHRICNIAAAQLKIAHIVLVDIFIVLRNAEAVLGFFFLGGSDFNNVSIAVNNSLSCGYDYFLVLFLFLNRLLRLNQSADEHTARAYEN